MQQTLDRECRKFGVGVELRADGQITLSCKRCGGP